VEKEIENRKGKRTEEDEEKVKGSRNKVQKIQRTEER
jgi:hypothetical protein